MHSTHKTYRFASLFGVLIAFASLSSQAQDTPANPDKTYDLSVKYSVGDLLKYKMQMNMNMEMKTPEGTSPFPGMEMVMSAVTRMKTAGIKPDGTAVIVMKNEKTDMSMNGSPMEVPDAPDITMDVDKRGIGKMRNMDKVPGAEVLSQVMNMNQLPTMGAILPDHPIKVGDTWETETPGPMSGKIKFTSTLLGIEKVGGLDTLKIKQIATMPMDIKMGPDRAPVADAEKAILVMKGDYSINSIVNVLEENGRVIKMISDIKADIGMEMKGEAAQQSPFGSKMNMKIDGKMNMNLLSVDKVTAPVPAVPTKKPVKKG